MPETLVQVLLPRRVCLVLVSLSAAAGYQASRSPDRSIEPVARLAERETRGSGCPSKPGREGSVLGVVAAGLGNRSRSFLLAAS